ncbi:hypothetical protein [Microbacterium sp. 18062]|uniref:hypothetical protein n=1 Tax=Microbacterium sp. 18062 TaxID=2681410 RepID=UPI0013593133|nr:hypothetical protein [Microbacterium sp. 18062]
MGSTVTAIALVSVSVLAMLAVLSALVWARSLTPRQGPFLSWGTVAATAAVFSSFIYLLWSFHPNVWGLAIGDVAMIWGPGFLWVAVASLNGRDRWPRWSVLAAGAAMFVVTMSLPEDLSTSVKVAVLIVFCIAAAAEALRRPTRARSGAVVIAVTTIAYALYCGGRLVSAAIGGMETGPYATYFSMGPTTMVGVIAVMLISFGVLRISQDARPELEAQRQTVRERLVEHAGGILAAGSAVTWQIVSIDELALVRESFGEDYVEQAHIALLTACRDAAPAGAEVGAVALTRIVVVGPVDGVELVGSELRTRLAQASPTLTDIYVPDVLVSSVRVETDDALAQVAAGS